MTAGDPEVFQRQRDARLAELLTGKVRTFQGMGPTGSECCESKEGVPEIEVKQDSLWVKNGPIKVLEQQEFSDWKCELFGMGINGITLNPAKGNVPNFFWRWMQYVCFGNRWRRVK